MHLRFFRSRRALSMSDFGARLVGSEVAVLPLHQMVMAAVEKTG